MQEGREDRKLISPAANIYKTELCNRQRFTQNPVQKEPVSRARLG